MSISYFCSLYNLVDTSCDDQFGQCGFMQSIKHQRSIVTALLTLVLLALRHRAALASCYIDIYTTETKIACTMCTCTGNYARYLQGLNQIFSYGAVHHVCHQPDFCFTFSLKVALFSYLATAPPYHSWLNLEQVAWRLKYLVPKYMQDFVILRNNCRCHNDDMTEAVLN